MNILKKLLVVVGLVSLAGCATIISGTNQSVTFDSAPEGAEVYIDGARVGVTPITVMLEKSAKSTVMIKKNGYQTVTRDLTKRFDNTAILNIFWDLSTTDAITGAWKEYEPYSYYIELQQK